MAKPLAPLHIPTRTWHRIMNLADLLQSDTMSVTCRIVDEAWHYALSKVKDTKAMRRKFDTRYPKNHEGDLDNASQT